MTESVRDKQIRPVFHHIHLITQFAVEREIIIRPTQTLSVSDTHTECPQILIRVGLRLLQLLIVVRVARVVIVVRIGVIQILIRLIVAVRVTCLRCEIHTRTQRVRSFSAQPRLQERYTCRGIIHTVRTCVDGECLSLTLRHNVTIRFLVEQVLYREVRELQSQRTDQSCRTPAKRELNLVR